MSSEDSPRYLLKGCHALVPGIEPSYHYVPSLEAGIAFLVLFGLSFLSHTIQCAHKRSWWWLVFSVGCIGEIIGWAGRTWNSQCPYNYDAFLMQISTLIIAPTFFTAGIYIILGRFINLLGREYSLISSKMYLIIFCTCDVISLVVQAVGGAMASSTNPKEQTPGTHTMVAGIAFQMFTLSIFCTLFAIFLYRARHVSLSFRIKLLTFATVSSVVFIYIRSIYRVIELSQGWNGFLISHQPYFIVLDGVMMVLAVGIFNIFHPAYLLPTPGEPMMNGVELK